MKIQPMLLMAALAAANACAGGLQVVQVPSAAMNRSIATSLVLPRDYAETDAPRPVLYLLHGAGDDERTWYTRTPVQEMADTHGVIVVSPSAGTSWYFDSPEDKSSRFETFVATELVTFVDGHYRTITNRAGRALAGNSMGGHGAMFLGIRHPDVFSAVAPMSGGMDIRASDPRVGAFPENWGLKQHLGSIQTHPGRWNERTVINLVDGLTNGELAISIDCGTDDFFLGVNRQLHAKLNARGIAHDYVEHPGQHSWDYWKAALPRQLADGRHVFWLDINHVFLRPDGAINTDMMWDLLHPSPAGAEAWAQAIEPILSQLMGDQPVNATAEQKGAPLS